LSAILQPKPELNDLGRLESLHQIGKHPDHKSLWLI